MKIVYYTSGTTGWGRVVIGMSIGNALKRKGIACEYTIVSHSGPSNIFGDIKHIELLLEEKNELSKDHYHNSLLFKTLSGVNPDILLVDHQWFMLFNFINDMHAKKIFLCHQVTDDLFDLGTDLKFDAHQYDRMIAIEPFKSKIDMDLINPVIFRNRDEILTRENALKKLNLDGRREACLFSFNPNTGSFDHLVKKYSYLEDVYDMVYAHKHSDSLFPEVDYFNAFDFMVCSGGYNQFWEAIYFNKEAVFEPLPLLHESHERRIAECQEYYFEENGADQLVDIIMGM